MTAVWWWQPTLIPALRIIDIRDLSEDGLVYKVSSGRVKTIREKSVSKNN